MTTNALLATDGYSDDFEASLAYPRFLLFGDSITQYCYNQYPVENTSCEFSLGAALSNIYTRKLDIVQRGFSGYNTEFGRIILPKIFALEHDSRPKEAQIKVMTLFLGSNDAALGGPEKVELPRFEENLQFLIELVLSKGIKLILVGPAWHNTQWYRKYYPEEYDAGIYRTTENNLKYSKIIEKCAHQYNAPFINLYDRFSKFDKTDDFNKLLSDGLHFNGKAYRMLYDAILETIQVNYPELHPSSIREKLPSWDNPRIIESLNDL